MTTKTIVSPEDQKVTFVELFFDLVFVFSVTQVVGLFHDELNLIAVGKAILVFWLVWWAWTQFTWALNAADTTHPLIQLATLVATGLAFFMAVTLPRAFGDQSVWFGVMYVLVRVLGLTIYLWVASANPAQQNAGRTFAILSIGGMAAVLIGAFIGGTLQLWLWGLAIVLDVVAAALGTQFEELSLHSEHFSERHGLFIIIALGESLIVAAGGVTDTPDTFEILLIAFLVVAITGALWWSYFPRTKPLLDQAVESARGSVQVRLARDVFSLLHFPMVCGIIAYAVVIEEIVLHPSEPLSLTGKVALSAGLLLFVGGMAVAAYRATRQVLLPRVILILVTVMAIVALNGVGIALTLGMALIGMLVILLIEQRSIRPLDNIQL
jgi:low temperature requirement protein LtrA